MHHPLTLASRAMRPAAALLRMAAPTPAGRAAAANAGASKKKGSTAIGGDSRYPLLKEYLIAPHAAPAAPSEADADEHAVIERAWKLAESQRLAALEKDRAAKYARLREAMLELEKADPVRFAAALEKDGEDMYFPRLLKAPTETPAKSGWDYRVESASPAAAAAAAGAVPGSSKAGKGKAGKGAKAAAAAPKSA
ncbi:hypothetical protein H9P43_004723 [Blastocladiella emersonii ATCC 22665]|nr:hypothetical protein H9P43_004723 [Blastocladiella emersonii ATCC 22665]